jgi:hypothetical protein
MKSGAAFKKPKGIKGKITRVTKIFKDMQKGSTPKGFFQHQNGQEIRIKSRLP